MEIVDISGKDGTCLKCHVGLNTEEKRSRMPLCTNCITELADIVKSGIDADGIEEFSEDVSDFTDFVSSSARLMGLDDIVIIQVCFNVYMDGVRDLADRHPSMARKIFKDARRFIDIELERLEDAGEDDLSKNDDVGNREIFEKVIGGISEMMKNYRNVNGRNDDVGSGSDDSNKENVDGGPNEYNARDGNIGDVNNDGRKEISKDGRKETKEGSMNGSKRIRVD